MSIEPNEIATEVLAIDPEHPEPEILARASECLHRGQVVAFPTETVYGLGANALDSAAVAEIFRAKGRPTRNPLIVHVADLSQLAEVVASWPVLAQKLAERFWPGPLTMILPKAPGISELVTAGGPTVGVRMPAHPVASRLIQVSGLPLAAPSANRSMELSPTRAAHVLESLGGRIPLILDGGKTPAGIESTVIDLTTEPPTLLRPGPILPALLESIIGPVRQSRPVAPHPENPGCGATGPLRSPGMLARHYAPRTPLICVRSIAELPQSAEGRLGLVVIGTPVEVVPPHFAEQRYLPGKGDECAAVLYDTLHELDHLNLYQIVVVLPPDTEEWIAIRDRLNRAATKE